MNSYRMKTQDLIDLALDWAVAKCMGHIDDRRVVVDFKYMSGQEPVRWEPRPATYYSAAYSPSTDWSLGGPIIEWEGIGLSRGDGTWGIGDGVWEASHPEYLYVSYGPTPLIAAMRCFVMARLGNEIDIPEELK